MIFKNSDTCKIFKMNDGCLYKPKTTIQQQEPKYCTPTTHFFFFSF